MISTANRRARLFAIMTLAAALPSQLAVGSEVPEVEFSDVLGAAGVQRLSDLRGAALLVEFWATWCGPCKAQIPHLRNLHDKLAGDGLVVVAISDEALAKVQPFAEQNQMTYPIAIARNAMRDWGVRGIPHAFLIAPDGKVAWSGHPGTLTEATITPHLALAVSPLQRLTEQLAPVQDLLDLRQRGKALAMLGTLRKTDKLTELSAKRAAKVEQGMQAQLAALTARAAASKTPFTRALALQELAKDWAGTPAAATAREELQALAKDAGAEVAAAEHTLQAERLTAKREFEAATAAWQKVVETGSSEASKRATAALDKLRENRERGNR